MLADDGVYDVEEGGFACAGFAVDDEGGDGFEGWCPGRVAAEEAVEGGGEMGGWRLEMGDGGVEEGEDVVDDLVVGVTELLGV